jgi:uncharacterized cupredoxin-like copper-binding protein
MNRKLLVSMFVLVTLALAACGGGEGEGSSSVASPAETIDVVMHDIYFGEGNDNAANPPTWEVTSGATVTVNLDNQGALEHNWAIVKSGEQVPLPFDASQHGDKLLYSTEVLEGGTTDAATFTAPEPGEYPVICTVAGHYPSMQGKLVVQ